MKKIVIEKTLQNRKAIVEVNNVARFVNMEDESESVPAVDYANGELNVRLSKAGASGVYTLKTKGANKYSVSDDQLTITLNELGVGLNVLEVRAQYGTNVDVLLQVMLNVPQNAGEDLDSLEYDLACQDMYSLPIPEQEQADWDESDDSKPSYIKNKPEIPDADVYQVGDSEFDYGGEIFSAENVAKIHAHGVELSEDAIATGEGAVAFGHYAEEDEFGVVATGAYSFAHGAGSEDGSTLAAGAYSHAEGKSCQAMNVGAHAEGTCTRALGEYSHSEGNNSEASGDYSHAEGYSCNAAGAYSHAEGNGTIADYDGQLVCGKFNEPEGTNDYALIVGNGTGNNARSNAFAIDWSGNLVLFDNGTPVVLTPAKLAQLIA